MKKLSKMKEIKMRPPYATWQNATKDNFTMWEKLLGICCKIDHVHNKRECFVNYILVYKNCGKRNIYAANAIPKITSTLQLMADIDMANL